ncbi:hypothetical protein FB451DRAFT_1558767 [Mycena latifolia]|nr:hypothetical protein FB451DRAFT_1558767 [Mycena latifolia]
MACCPMREDGRGLGACVGVEGMRGLAGARVAPRLPSIAFLPSLPSASLSSLGVYMLRRNGRSARVGRSAHVSARSSKTFQGRAVQRNAVASGSKPKGRRKGRIKDGGGVEEEPPPAADEEGARGRERERDLGKGKGRGKGKGKQKQGEREAGDEGGGDEGTGKGKGKVADNKGKGRDAADTDTDTDKEEREREKEREREEEDARCAKITDLLVAGKKGPALEAAVEAWEGEGRGRGRGRERERERERRTKGPGAGAARRGRERPASLSADEGRADESPFEERAPSSPFEFTHQQQPADAPSPSPYAQPGPSSPFTQHPPSSPFAPHPPASPYSPYTPFASPSASASPVPAPARASTLMLPPLTHMYKRSLSAPCGARCALPSDSLASPVLSVYVPPPVPQDTGQQQDQERQEQEEQRQGQQGQLQRQQQYALPPLQTHVRRDTISAFPAAAAGYALPARRARGAYTYPPPYLSLPDVEPGLRPRYGGAGRAGAWWDRARGTGGGAGADEGGDVYARQGGTYAREDGDADAGWADGGVPAFSGAFAPSPSPPLPIYGEAAGDAYGKATGDAYGKATGDAYGKAAREAGGEGGRADPYTLPLPLSPASAQPAISSFSTLSGGRGVCAGGGRERERGGGGGGGGQAGASGSGSGRRTSGWYQPPGWESSVQGQGLGSPWTGGDADGEGYKPWPALEWPARGDVEMYDAGGWGAPR